MNSFYNLLPHSLNKLRQYFLYSKRAIFKKKIVTNKQNYIDFYSLNKIDN